MKQTDILSFFNLEGNPFGKEIKTDDLISLETFDKAFESVMLLIETKGIGILTGPSGSGKSSLLRRCAAELNPGLHKPFYICHTSLGTAEFYQTVASSLGLSPQGRRVSVFRRIKDFISNLNDEKRIHPVIFIDEAHALTSDSLKELRMLTNFDYDSKNACTLLLCGHTDLRQKLGLNIFTSLANSITYTIVIDALPADQTFTYIENRIVSQAGISSLFTKNAMKLIHDASAGIIRTIGNIAWQSLIKAYLSKSAQVEKEHVQMVVAG